MRYILIAWSQKHNWLKLFVLWFGRSWRVIKLWWQLCTRREILSWSNFGFILTLLTAWTKFRDSALLDLSKITYRKIFYCWPHPSLSRNFYGFPKTNPYIVTKSFTLLFKRYVVFEWSLREYSSKLLSRNSSKIREQIQIRQTYLGSP